MKIYLALAFAKNPLTPQRITKAYLKVQNADCEYKESNLSIHKEVGKADVLELCLWKH